MYSNTQHRPAVTYGRRKKQPTYIDTESSPEPERVAAAVRPSKDVLSLDAVTPSLARIWHSKVKNAASPLLLKRSMPAPVLAAGPSKFNKRAANPAAPRTPLAEKSINFSRIVDNNKAKLQARKAATPTKRKVSPPHRMVSRVYATTRVSVTSAQDDEPGPRAPANAAAVRSKRVIIDSASSSSNVTESENSDVEVDDLPSRLRGPIGQTSMLEASRRSTARTAKPLAAAAAGANKRVTPTIDLTVDSAGEDLEPFPMGPPKRTLQARRTVVDVIEVSDSDSVSSSAPQDKPAALLRSSIRAAPQPPPAPVQQPPPPVQQSLPTVKPPAPRRIMQAVELPRLPASWRAPVKAPRAAASPVKRKVFTVSTPSRARAVIPTRYKVTQAPVQALHFLAREDTEDEEDVPVPATMVTKSVRPPSPSPTPSANTDDDDASTPPNSPPPPPRIQTRKSVVPPKTRVSVVPPTKPAAPKVIEEEAPATRTVTKKSYAQSRRPPSPSPTPGADSEDDPFTPPASPPPTRARKSVVPPKARATPIKAAARPSLATSLRPAPIKPSTKVSAPAPALSKSRHATRPASTPAYLQNLVHECGQDAPYDFDAFLSFFPYDDVHGLLGDAGLAYRKVGEASFSEVWAIGEVVLKVVPLRDPNGQARGFGESEEMPDVSEVEDVIREVGMTREMGNVCEGFVKLLKTFVVEGKYPQLLLDLWDAWDRERKSESVRPSSFTTHQAYAILVLPNLGTDLESFTFRPATAWSQASAVFFQTLTALASAERAARFEHRDLHWGQIMLQRTPVPRAGVAAGTKLDSEMFGVRATIIDLGLSRMQWGGRESGAPVWTAFEDCIFEGEGDYQFDVYRMMTAHIGEGQAWKEFRPLTNLMWLHYLLVKLIQDKKLPKYPAAGREKGCADILDQVERLILQCVTPPKKKGKKAAPPPAVVFACAGDVERWAKAQGWL